MNIQYKPKNNNHMKQKGEYNNSLKWINNDPKYCNILHVANFYLDIQNIIRGTLPINIANFCYVGYIGNNEIILKVPSASYATKIKQLIPSIINNIIKTEKLEINQNHPIVINVKVQYDLNNLKRKNKNKEFTPFNKKDINEFKKLENNVKNIKLKQAISNITNK